jgi:hypothetical protein
MPKPDINRMKMATDNKRRLLLVERGGFATDWSAGLLRGGTTQGPVGDLWN